MSGGLGCGWRLTSNSWRAKERSARSLVRQPGGKEFLDQKTLQLADQQVLDGICPDLRNSDRSPDGDGGSGGLPPAGCLGSGPNPARPGWPPRLRSPPLRRRRLRMAQHQHPGIDWPRPPVGDQDPCRRCCHRKQHVLKGRRGCACHQGLGRLRDCNRFSRPRMVDG